MCCLAIRRHCDVCITCDGIAYGAVQLVNWPFLDFQMRVKTDTAIFTLKACACSPWLVDSLQGYDGWHVGACVVAQKKLRERHGRMEELRMYKESPSTDCELTNEMLTLEQAGIDGLPKNEVPPKVSARHPQGIAIAGIESDGSAALLAAAGHALVRFQAA